MPMTSANARGPYRTYRLYSPLSATAKARVQGGFTQAQAALICGVSRRTLCQWEKDGSMHLYVENKLARANCEQSR